ncbi:MULTISPECIES: metallophosphoesterase family protein [unclassified Pseudodesulfovibrio]|uniref:metallophosphoesterase family protein n=1 Tax=unclassified Pseudodesulfovibrio TaxID=2661612 RepID=UPI000FEBD695|nr:MULTISPECIES: metallophosphoesterase family protein [unclassified Pseudodesulfovibrio]MCJ2165871.1 YfcE family phosphodiesterase [Pseudodesulfovibrio sp. S3-i]RWU02697.1 metallophosphoesterase [Pseudodesulfovibrio sp. S3]
MQIAVISDTHMGTPSSWLETVYGQWLGPADVLVHCGDITSFATWSYFMQHDNFLCVRGNCDWDPNLADQLDPMISVQLGPVRLGVAHGWGPRSQVAVKVAQAFGPDYDLVCYGHTHARDWSMVEGVQLLNPGSLGESGSLALVQVDGDGSLRCEFVDAV